MAAATVSLAAEGKGDFSCGVGCPAAASDVKSTLIRIVVNNLAGKVPMYASREFTSLPHSPPRQGGMFVPVVRVSSPATQICSRSRIRGGGHPRYRRKRG